MKTYPWTGPVVRVGVALMLCAACFQAGRWYQELSASAAPAAAKGKADPGNEIVSSTFHGAPEPAAKAEPAPLVSAGNPVGQNPDIITPLNVRDPSALVMGPGAVECAPPPPAAPSPSARPMDAKPLARKLRTGRLLELLKKADKKSVAPKDF